MVQEFFQALFQSSNPSHTEVSNASGRISSCFDQAQREVLSMEFTEEDVRLAIFDLNRSKSPGLDGFHEIFFQKFWHILREDFTRVCLSILNGSASIMDFNYGV